MAVLEEALARAGATSTTRGLSIAHLNLGYIALVEGEIERADREFREAVTIAADTDDVHGEARALAALACAAVERGDVQDALHKAWESLERGLTINNTEVVAWPLELAGVALADADPDRAARLLGAAQKLRDDLGIVQSGLELEQHERARGALGSAYDDAWQSGRKLPLEAVRGLVVERLGEQRRDVGDAQLASRLAHAVVEHHRAERARDGERLGARRDRLASRARALICVPVSSIHMCAPPAPQQNVCLPLRFISTG